MSGSSGDGSGFVYLAHAWCPDEHRKDTAGPWHWWNVYRDQSTASMQAFRAAQSWKTYGQCEVHVVEGRRH